MSALAALALMSALAALAIILLAAAAPCVPATAPDSPGTAIGAPPGQTARPGAATLQVFADFRCPHCARFAVSHMPALARRFQDEIKSGALVIEHRNLPILGQPSRFLAQLGECAAAQGRFQAYHDALYAHQYRAAVHQGVQPINGPGEPLDAVLRAAAVNTRAARTCMATAVPVQALREHLDRARSLNLTYTPALVLNDQVIHWRDFSHIVAQVETAIHNRTRTEE